MQQDTYFYPMSSNFEQPDARMQFQNANPYHMQPDVAAWSNYIPGNINPGQSVFNSIDQNPAVHPSPNALLPPVSTAVYGTTSTCSWAHTVPSLMPWVTRNDANVPDPIVRFTAPFPPDPCTSQTATSWELLNNLGANKTNVNMHLKRKNELDILDTAPQKLCVTEERMAARLRELHISNQYSVPSENSPFGPYGDSTNSGPEVKSVTNLKQLEAMLKDCKSGAELPKSLVLAPELKKLVEPEKIFANTFLDKVERPSMALVLWQPQNNVLTGLNNNSEDAESQDRNEKSKLSPQPVTEIRNNNFLPQQLSAMCNQILPFALRSGNPELSSHVNSDDVMDT